jgi:hypothetical protein
MTILGHYISIYSGLIWWPVVIVAYIVLCGLCYGMCVVAGDADVRAGRK